MSNSNANLASNANPLFVIDPAILRPELESFNWIARNSALPTTYHLPALFGMASIEEVQLHPRGILVLGSASSVHDGLPWQEPLHRWVKQKIGLGVPTLGICYGHQLIAHLHGGVVEFRKPDRSKRTGFHSVSLKPNRLWNDRALVGELAFSHNEIVTQCPNDFEVTASSDEVPIEGLAHQTHPVWSFQAHPEASSRYLGRFNLDVPSSKPKLEFGRARVLEFLRFVAAHPAREE